MKAFHSDKAIKKKYLARVLAHRRADEIVQRYGYWKGGKGCAVGCTIHGDKHQSYETELGIPEWLARLEDTLFEGMSEERAKLWPEQFLKAIPVGADLEPIKGPFLIFVLNNVLLNFDNAKFPEVAEAIHSVIALYEIGEATEEDFKEAAKAAKAAEAAAWAAEAAKAAKAAEAAAWAAESAAWGAESAAWGAESAAWGAWAAAGAAAGAAESAAWGAESKEAVYSLYADKLLELLQEAK